MKLRAAVLPLVFLVACSREAQLPVEPGAVEQDRTAPVPAQPATVSEDSFKVGPELPIGSGTYVFRHRFAEHPSIKSIELKVIIDGRKVTVVNEQASDVFEKGVLDEGFLLWHSGSEQWIIARSDADQDEFDVGGCSHGPAVIDLVGKVYWTC